jgi:hypothetical protein
MSSVTRVKTDPATIRRLYADAQIEARYGRGELTMGLRSSGSPTSKREPNGTESQMVEFHNKWGMLICIAHQYLRPDGTIGASGKRDPKYLRVGSTVYTV